MNAMMRLFVTASFSLVSLTLAEQACDAVPEELLEIEAEEAANLADEFQLLQVATSFEEVPTKAIDVTSPGLRTLEEPPAQPELGGDGSERRPGAAILSEDDIQVERGARKQNEMPQGVIPSGLVEEGEDVYPPGVNETDLMEKIRQLEKDPASFLTLGFNSTRQLWAPVTFRYNDGSASVSNYCTRGHRSLLNGGTPMTLESCAHSSCAYHALGRCGTYFYTTAVPGDPASTGVCKCCKPDPVIRKSSQGNKIYSCR